MKSNLCQSGAGPSPFGEAGQDPESDLSAGHDSSRLRHEDTPRQRRYSIEKFSF